MLTGDQIQLAQVCEALLGAVKLPGLWTERGPSERLRGLLSKGGELSAEQTAVARFALALWERDDALSVRELLEGADSEGLTAIGTLLVAAAYGRASIADWLAVQRGDDGAVDADDEPPPFSH